ncbi:MAG: TetR/AcrR family transcriptional regulator [Solobacterium sp.]|nr:TetR/AcrR family transcriptional regulator [Solobacterium sp.]
MSDRKMNADVRTVIPEKLAETMEKIARRKPVSRITVRELCAACGVSGQTFYNYFPDKYALMVWAYKSQAERSRQKFESGEYSFRDVTVANLKYCDEHAVFMLNAISNTNGPDSYYVGSSESTIASAEEYIANRFGRDALTDTERTHLRMFVYACSGICVYWLSTEKKKTAEELADDIITAMPVSLHRYFL